jgi:hypothetical protein
MNYPTKDNEYNKKKFIGIISKNPSMNFLGKFDFIFDPKIKKFIYSKQEKIDKIINDDKFKPYLSKF